MSIPFSQSEYEHRLATVKSRMVERGFDLLISGDPANLDYLTGYSCKTYYTPQVIIIDLESDQPFWFGRLMDINGAQRFSYLRPENILNYADDYVQSTERHPMDRLAELALDRGWGRKRIGIDMEANFFHALSMDRLRARLPDARFSNTDHLINWVRLVKSPAEIEFMRQAGQITDLGMQAGMDAVNVGSRQNDAAAAILKALISGTPEFGGGQPCSFPMLPTGADFAATYHADWGDQPFLNGTATGFEFTAARHHYTAPLARTIFLGNPPQKLVDATNIMIEGLEAIVAALQPGRTAEEVEGAWREVAVKRGVDKNARIGYPVGLGYAPDWGEHTASLRQGDRTVMEENMTFHCIPSLMVDDWGIEFSETVRVAPGGGEPLSKFPRELVIKR